MAMTAANNPATSFMESMKGRALDALPSAGGLAGGAIGGLLGNVPGAIGGAGIGGAAGEAAREGLGGKPVSAGGVAKSAAEQAFLQALGIGVAKGVGAAAKPLMRRALGISGKLIEKFPGTVEATLKTGRSLPKADLMRRESAQTTQNLLSSAKAGGFRTATRDVTQGAEALAKDDVIPEAKLAIIQRDLDAFLKKHGPEIDPVKLKKIKRYYQKQAKPAYHSVSEGEVAATNPEFAMEIAGGAQRELEKIPFVGAQEANTRAHIGAQKAVKASINRTPKPLTLHSPGTFPVVKNLYGPQVQSKLAVWMADPHLQSVARQSPRVVMALLAQLTHSDEPDATR